MNSNQGAFGSARSVNDRDQPKPEGLNTILDRVSGMLTQLEQLPQRLDSISVALAGTSKGSSENDIAGKLAATPDTTIWRARDIEMRLRVLVDLITPRVSHIEDQI